MKLSDYLETVGETHEAFAARLGVSQVSVTRYVAGKRLPRPHVLTKIAEETKGAVTANDFMLERESPASKQQAGEAA